MRQILAVIVLAFALAGATAKVYAQQATSLLTAATATGAGTALATNAVPRTFQATGTTSAGAGAATIKIQGSNVNAPSVDGDYVDLGTITLTLSTTKSGDGFVSSAPWRWVRANVTAISGTNASVDVLMKATSQ